ncbi:hypothetical protein, partial [Flagellimonas marinaquae]
STSSFPNDAPLVACNIVPNGGAFLLLLLHGRELQQTTKDSVSLQNQPCSIQNKIVPTFILAAVGLFVCLFRSGPLLRYTVYGI